MTGGRCCGDEALQLFLNGAPGTVGGPLESQPVTRSNAAGMAALRRSPTRLRWHPAGIFDTQVGSTEEGGRGNIGAVTSVSTESVGEPPGRRAVHLLFGLPAFLLVYLDWRLALGIAVWFLFLNAEVLPRTRLAAGWFRAGEGWTGGIVTYPLTVAVLVALFREDSLPAAAGWVAMAFGDGGAAIVGRRWRLLACPWNRAKSVGGMLGFLAGAGPALAVVHGQYEGFGWGSCGFAVAVAAGGAVLETIPVPVNDNPVVGLTSGFIAYLLGRA